METPIDSRTQRRALDAILNALSLKELQIPSRIVAMIPPKLESSPVSDLEWPVRYDPPAFLHVTFGRPIELPLQTDGAFDPLGWVNVFCDTVVRDVLRQMPMVADQYGSGQADLSVGEILSRLLDETWGIPALEHGSLADLARLVQVKVLDGMILMAEYEETPATVAETTRGTLDRLMIELQSRKTTDDPAERAHLEEAIRKLAKLKGK